MRMKGIYPNTQDYLFDSVWAYCEYIRGLRNEPE